MIDALVARLRPILVTSLSTLGGVLPTAYGFGGYDDVMAPLSLALGWGIAHPVPFNLNDPLNTYTVTMSEQEKANKRLVEVNNGRLAMLGLMGFISEAKIPGSVPGLANLIKGYDGDVMAPFSPEFSMFS